MTTIRSFASHIIDGTTALALSLALIGGTVSNPAAPVVASQEIMA